MASSVNVAFATFLRETVNLDAQQTRTARASRAWLLSQLAGLPAKDTDAPPLLSDADIFYGSFERRTKIRPLDDIDLIVGIQAQGASYGGASSDIRITVPDGVALRALCHAGTAQLNSRRVINAFVRALVNVPQYDKADIGRDGSAAVLNLQSYPWSFDVVPGFITDTAANGRSYFVIPNGAGHWMTTDPRIDRDRVRTLNTTHNGNLLNVIRLLKYWNRRPTMPSVPSYLFECLLLQHFAARGALQSVSSFVDLELPSALAYLTTAIYGAVPDPKGIQGNLNTLSFDDQFDVAVRARLDLDRAARARAAEDAEDHKTAVGLWREIFGPAFPTFG